MAGLVLVALIVMAIVFIVVSKNRKRAMLISVGVIGVYHLYVSHSCGPNSADVKVMKPMAEKISEYIVKNGIPKSLKDIPDLPYGLEGCKSEQTYYKFDNKVFANIEVPLKKDAEFKIVKEKCHFKKKNRSYYIHIIGEYNFIPNKKSLDINIGNKNSKTWDNLTFYSDKNKTIFVDKEINFGSSNTSGICNTLKQ